MYDDTNSATHHRVQKSTWFDILTATKHGGYQQEPTHAPVASRKLTDSCDFACGRLADVPVLTNPEQPGSAF